MIRRRDWPIVLKSATSLLTGGGAAATILVLSTVLPVGEYAVLSLLLTCLAFWLLVADAGLNIAYVRSVVRADDGDRDVITQSALRARLLTGGLAAVLGAASLPVLFNFANQRLPVGAVPSFFALVFVESLFHFFLADLQARSQWKREAIVNTAVHGAVFLTSVAAVVLFTRRASTAILAFALVYGIWAAWATYALWMPRVWSRQAVKELFGFGVHLAAAGVAYFFVGMVDTFFISRHGTSADVAAYFLALSIFGLLRQVVGGVEAVLVPRLSRWTDSSDAAHRAVAVSGLFALLGAVLGSVVVAAPLLRHLHVAGAETVTTIVAWMLPVFVLRVASVPLTNYLLAVMGQSRVARNVQLMSGALSVAGDALLIPRLGYRGAVIATAIAYVAVWLTLLWRLPVDNAAVVVRIVPVVAIAGGVAWLLATRPIAAAVAAGLAAPLGGLMIWRSLGARTEMAT